MPLDLPRLKTLAARLDWSEWIIWFGVGGWCAWTYLTTGNPWMSLVAVFLLTPGCLQLSAHRWAWHAGLIAWAGGIVLGANMFIATPTLWRGLTLVGFVWGLWNQYRERPRFLALTASLEEDNAALSAPDTDDAAENSAPAHSLVLWLREPRFLDDSILSRLASRALDLPFNAGDDSPHFVVGKENLYMLRVHDELYHLHQWPRNYFDDPATTAGSLRELRRAEAITGHQAWLAIDFMGGDKDPAPERVMPRIGRLLAAIAAEHDDVLAVYHPASGRIAPWDPTLADKLASGEPFTAFVDPEFAPVIRVSDEDPAMQAAVAEARRRWPEFVAAFHAATDKDRFAVKAPVTEADRTEFIWITVKAIADGRVHGFLANEPVALGDLKLGSFVSVHEADLNDWVCPDPAGADRPLGLFTVAVVAAAARE